MLTLAVSSFGQRGPRANFDLTQLASELDLSESQIAELDKVNATVKLEMQALKSNESMSYEDRKAKMHQLRKDSKSEVAKILSDEQKEKLRELRSERREKIKEQHKDSRAKKEERTAELSKLRAEFDASIDSEDKVTIEEIKASIKAHRSEMKAMKKRNHEDMKRNKQDFKNKNSNEVLALKELTEKYNEEIKSFLNEKGIEKGQQDQPREMKGKQQRKGEMKKGKGQMKQEKGKMKKGKGQMNQRNGSRASRFLLLDFDESSKAVKYDDAQMRIFPNPSSDWTNVEYEVRTTGDVLVQIKDESGNIVQTLVTEVQDKGQYTIELNTSKLASKNYFIVVTDKLGLTSKQLVNIK